MEGIPIPGQLVTVRQRGFVVSDVAASSLEPHPLGPLAEQTARRLMKLQVVWKPEPGARAQDLGRDEKS